MKNNTYKILKIINKEPLTSNQIKELTINSICSFNYLLRTKKYITYSGITENGGPQEPLVISEIGIEYLCNRKDENHKFVKDFFSRFISGFIVGVLTSVVAAIILFKLGITP